MSTFSGKLHNLNNYIVYVFIFPLLKVPKYMYIIWSYSIFSAGYNGGPTDAVCNSQCRVYAQMVSIQSR